MTQVGHTWITADLPPTAFSGLHCYWTTEKNIQPVKKVSRKLSHEMLWETPGFTVVVVNHLPSISSCTAGHVLVITAKMHSRPAVNCIPVVTGYIRHDILAKILPCSTKKSYFSCGNSKPSNKDLRTYFSVSFCLSYANLICQLSVDAC